MSTAPWVHAVPAAAFDPAVVQRVAAAATEHDGVEPLNEAALIALRHHGLADGALWLAGAGSDAAPEGFAWLHGTEVELVVAPAARGRGVGTALADVVAAARPDAGTAGSTGDALAAWSHGNHPAAARLAHRHGWERVRDLWVMRRPLADLPPVDEALERVRAAGVAVRTFRPGHDEAAFLALNARAFAQHPEQGRMTREDLDRRMAEAWFDTEGFFVAERAAEGTGELLGFHWTKVHDTDPPVGEVYVVGVSPEAQGTGLGRLLTLTGLHHLARLGLDEVLLYVESDNAAAVATYEGLGFTHRPPDTHVMYRARR